MKQFKTTVVKVLTNNVEQHEILSRFGRRKLDQHLKREVKRYGMVNLPVAIIDKNSGKHIVISNWEIVEQSRSEGANQIDVNVIDCPVGEAPRLFNYLTSYRQKRDYTELPGLIAYLKDHMQNTDEGKEWKDDMGGSLRQNIAALLGYKDSMITHIETIAKYAPDLLEELTSGTSTWSIAREKVKVIKAKREKEEIKKMGNTSGKSNTAPVESKSLAPNFEEPTTTEMPTGFTTTTSTGQPRYNSTSTPPPGFAASALPEFVPEKMILKIDGMTDMALELIDGQITNASLNGDEQTGLILKFFPGKDYHVLNVLKAGNSILSITINQSILK